MFMLKLGACDGTEELRFALWIPVGKRTVEMWTWSCHQSRIIICTKTKAYWKVTDLGFREDTAEGERKTVFPNYLLLQPMKQDGSPIGWIGREPPMLILPQGTHEPAWLAKLLTDGKLLALWMSRSGGGADSCPPNQNSCHELLAGQRRMTFAIHRKAPLSIIRPQCELSLIIY